MARTKIKRWLTLGEAASRLGVDEATLRHWADTGRIKTFRTPGGHRRFREDDLQTLMQQDTPRVDNLGHLVERRGAKVLASGPAKGLHARPWFLNLDDNLRARARGHGRALFENMVRFVAEPESRRGLREHVLREAHQYGSELRDAGVTPAVGADAFGHFRHVVLEMVTKPRGRGGLLDENQIRALVEVSDLLDAILLTMVKTLERPITAVAPPDTPRLTDTAL